MMGYILKDYPIPIPAGDQYDPFHENLMTTKEMEYSMKGWRTAWKGKVMATLETVNTFNRDKGVVLLAVEGGGETQWEKKWLLERAMSKTGVAGSEKNTKRKHTRIDGMLVFKNWYGLVKMMVGNEEFPEKPASFIDAMVERTNNGIPRTLTGGSWSEDTWSKAGLFDAQVFYPGDTDTSTKSMTKIKVDFVPGE